jgi:hypothetical protein
MCYASRLAGDGPSMLHQRAVRHLPALAGCKVIFGGQVNKEHRAFTDSKEGAATADNVGNFLDIAKLIPWGGQQQRQLPPVAAASRRAWLIGEGPCRTVLPVYISAQGSAP